MVLKNEIEKLKTELVTEKEIALAIAENQKMMDAYLNDSRLPFYITRYEANGF